MKTEADNKESAPEPGSPGSRIRAWGMLFFFSFCIWGFGAYVGPWIQNSIPTMKQIVQVIEEDEIDAGAYFYTEIEASFEGERYLRESLAFADKRNVQFTLPFLSGVVLCCVILAVGFRFLPDN